MKDHYIEKHFQTLHEEIWVNGVNPKLKLEHNSEPENKMSKSNCKECKNSFNTSTLKKYDGYCGRCSKKVSETTSSTQPDPAPSQPVTDSKYSKKKIPERLRQEVWEKNIGDKFWGNCFTCNMRLCAFEFSCGHVVSEADGGPTVLENLKVVCKSCNSKMGTQNMMTFKEHRYSSSSPQPEVTYAQPIGGINVRRTSTLIQPITDIRDFTGNRDLNLSGNVRTLKKFGKIPCDEPPRMSKFSG